MNIRPLATGPGTPWPNRAESAVRLPKGQLRLMLDSIEDGAAAEAIQGVSYQELVKQACLVRNSSVTYGGVVTPMNLRSEEDQEM